MRLNCNALELQVLVLRSTLRVSVSHFSFVPFFFQSENNSDSKEVHMLHFKI